MAEIFTEIGVCIIRVFLYHSDRPPMTGRFEQDRTALYSEPKRSDMGEYECVIALELFYGGYWKGINFVKSRNTYSLATVAVTVVFNVSSNRLVLPCHVS